MPKYFVLIVYFNKSLLKKNLCHIYFILYLIVQLKLQFKNYVIIYKIYIKQISIIKFCFNTYNNLSKLDSFHISRNIAGN